MRGENPPPSRQSRTTPCPAHQHQCEGSRFHFPKCKAIFGSYYFPSRPLPHRPRGLQLAEGIPSPPARLPAARTTSARPGRETCALPAGLFLFFFLFLLKEKKKKAEQGKFADLESEGDVASCAVTADVGRCHQPSPRSSGNVAQSCSAAPRLFLARAPTQPWQLLAMSVLGTAQAPSAALPPGISILRPRGTAPSPLKPRWGQIEVGKMSVIPTKPRSVCPSGSSAGPRPLASESCSEQRAGAGTGTPWAPEGIPAPRCLPAATLTYYLTWI